MLDDEVVIRLLDHGAVRSADGRRLGRVGQLFRSDSDGESTWVSIAADDSGGPQTLVPMTGSFVDGDDLQVAYPADAVTGAPQVAVGAPVSGDDQRRIRAFYALDGAADTAAADTAARTDAVEVIRSEEQLSVATQWVPVRRARLEKFLVTQTRTIEVEWSREDVRVVDEPVEPAVDGTAHHPAADLDPATGRPVQATPQPWVLMEERIVVTKEWVPMERVRLVVDQVTGEQEVTGPVRKEQVDLDPFEPAGSTVHDVDQPADA